MHTSTPEEIQDVDCAVDEPIAVPEDAVAVEHPGIILVQQALIVSGGG
jgi:hypothetical protein